MGFFSPADPPFEYAEWRRRPHLERIKLLAQDWALNGFGTPGFVYLLYLAKLVLYAGGGLLLISATTPGLGGLGLVQRAVDDVEGRFEPGEVRVVVLESQPAHQQRQRYRIFDAATGLVEEGWVNVADVVERQPWLDERPFPVETIGEPAPGRAAVPA